jgi:hypothetical protein
MDLRKVGFVPMMDDIQPAGIIHQMSIDLVFDPETRVIGSLDAAQPVVAIEPSRASRGECCRDPVDRLDALVGERLDDDFVRRLGAVFGGPLGCSHLLTLLQMMGPATIRAIGAEASLPADLVSQRADGERIYWRSLFVDGIEADHDRVALALQQSDFHTRPAAVVDTPFDRLAGEWDVRVSGLVDTAMRLTDLHASERQRTHESLGTASFVDRTDRIAALDGGLIIPGLARRVLALLGDAADDALLRDALLHLAPGHIQVMAALMDRWFSRSAAGSDTAPASGGERELPEVGSVGGMPDSCYMWRTGGALSGRGFGRGALESRPAAEGEEPGQGGEDPS